MKRKITLYHTNENMNTLAKIGWYSQQVPWTTLPVPTFPEILCKNFSQQALKSHNAQSCINFIGWKFALLKTNLLVHCDMM